MPGAPPNTHVCAVCLGMPGSLPVINKTAVEYTILTALAFHCEIPEFAKFDRKNYHYPDLMKGYQISQYDLPLSLNGYVLIDDAETIKRIRVRRVHLEEDTAKLAHVDGTSLIDVNRSGTPLMEIVSEPDMHSVEEARLYSLKLQQILRYLGVCSGDMEKGAMRFEANISLRPKGSTAAFADARRNQKSELASRDGACHRIRDCAANQNLACRRNRRSRDDGLGRSTQSDVYSAQ